MNMIVSGGYCDMNSVKLVAGGGGTGGGGAGGERSSDAALGEVWRSGSSGCVDGRSCYVILIDLARIAFRSHGRPIGRFQEFTL